MTNYAIWLRYKSPVFGSVCGDYKGVNYGGSKVVVGKAGFLLDNRRVMIGKREVMEDERKNLLADCEVLAGADLVRIP